MELPARKNGGMSVEMENMGYVSDNLSPSAIRITQYDINHLTVHQVRICSLLFNLHRPIHLCFGLQHQLAEHCGLMYNGRPIHSFELILPPLAGD